MSLNYYLKYGNPYKYKGLVLWDVPAELEIGVIPKKIYCNKDLIDPLQKAFKELIATGAVNELKTWDGCYNLRPIRGYEKKYQLLIDKGLEDQAMKYLSSHCWGMAIDVNAAWNGLGKEPKLSKKFVQCFNNQGFIWGGNFKRKDGMHFEFGV